MRTIQSVKKNLNSSIILVGGDFNRFNIRPHLESFKDVTLVELAATCNGAILDRIATNILGGKITVRSPLQIGTKKSDHAVVHFEADLGAHHEFKKRIINRRKFSEEGLEKFGKELAGVNWQEVYSDVAEDPDEQVKKLNEILETIVDDCFKMRRLTIKTTDAPWLNKYIKNKITSCLLYTSPSPRDRQKSRMPSSA